MMDSMKRLISSLLGDKEETHGDLSHLDKLMDLIDYHFRTKKLLLSAISHTSISGKEGKCSSFERMEFLGDSVLGLVIAESVFEKFPEYTEGQLSKLKAKVVSRDFLATVARDLGIGKYLLISKEAEKGGGRDNSSILADTMESIICAIYLDGGIDSARAFIIKFLFKDYKKVFSEKDLINYKSKLQEHTQLEDQSLPEYRLTSETGPDHAKQFEIEVLVNGSLMGKGKGKTKKEAQQKAAKEACNNLDL